MDHPPVTLRVAYMDHLSRLSRLLLAVVLCFASPAWAANYVTKQPKYRAGGYPFRADVNTACVDAFSAYAGTWVFDGTYRYWTAAYYLCDGTHTNGERLSDAEPALVERTDADGVR